SYTASDLGMPGISLSSLDGTVANATDLFNYCTFAVTTIPSSSVPAKVAAFNVNGQWSTPAALPGTDSASSSIGAVRWADTGGVVHFSSFVRSNTGNVYEGRWPASCDGT